MVPIIAKSFLFAFTFLSVNAKDCSVSFLNNSKIIGALEDSSVSSKKICSYRSIPFAAPPTGPNRFRSPRPAPQWEGTLNATSHPNWCPQGSQPPEGVQMSEDCLYLNVHVPQAQSNSSLPVMIWFHGGSFTSGSTQHYTPYKLLSRGDVILVVAHYRLGLLGFFSTGDLSSPGNYGLKDQSFAIKWVHQHIKYFGGNPKQITIFGESAGGASVMFQMISPLNADLISGVIAQSGTALAMWAIDPSPKESGRLMAMLSGCPPLPSFLTLICMRLVPWQKFILIQQTFTLFKYSQMQYPSSGLIPVVEPPHPEAFISQTPLEIMKSGQVPKIPLMIGATKHDGSFILAALYLVKYGPQKLDQNPDYMRNRMVPELLKFTKVEEDGANRAVSSSVEMAYLSGVNRSSWDESMPGLVDILSVFAFKSSIQNTADILSENGVPVYLYSFEHHSNNSLYSELGGSEKVPVKGGIAHADDLIYLFDLVHPGKFSVEDQSFSNLFCDMWINFGTSGNPTPSSSQTKWPAYNTREEHFIKLNTTPTVLEGYRTSWKPNGFDWN